MKLFAYILLSVYVIKCVQETPLSPPKIKGYQTGTPVYEGDTLNISCELKRADPSNHYVKFQCYKDHESEQRCENDTVIAELSFKILRSLNLQKCSCSALDVDSDERTITVYYPPSVPTLQPGPNGFPWFEGQQDRYLNCSVSDRGNPQSEYVWFRDDVNDSSQTSSTWTFASLSYTDNGSRFYCQAENDYTLHKHDPHNSSVQTLDVSSDTTESPTKSTTESPTKSTTESPTKSTTESPTKSTTESPTTSTKEYPTTPTTESPTKSTTRSPTESPTESTSESPTESPTSSRTESHTESASESPTESPLESPTEPLVWATVLSVLMSWFIGVTISFSVLFVTYLKDFRYRWHVFIVLGCILIVLALVDICYLALENKRDSSGYVAAVVMCAFSLIVGTDVVIIASIVLLGRNANLNQVSSEIS